MAALGLQKALVVDDDRDIVEQVERVLKRCGIAEIVHLRRLQAAGARIAEGFFFDIIIVDVDMSELDGGSLLERLAGGGTEGVNHMPILFIAEVHSRSDVAALQDAGCHIFLMKPLNDSILEAKISEVAKKSFSPEREVEVIREIKESLSRNQLNEAERQLKPILRRYPASAKYQVLLAELFFLKGDLKNASSVVAKTLRLDPDFTDAVELSEKLQLRTNEVEAARKIAEENARREAIFREAQELNVQALSYARNGSFDDAIRLYDLAVEKSEGMPRRHIILFNAAMGYFKAGKFERAKELCNLSLENSEGSYEKAQTLLDKILEEERKHAPAEAPIVSDNAFITNVEGLDAATEKGKESQNALLNPEEEARILKFIMFEGKY